MEQILFFVKSFQSIFEIIEENVRIFVYKSNMMKKYLDKQREKKEQKSLKRSSRKTETKIIISDIGRNV